MFIAIALVPALFVAALSYNNFRKSSKAVYVASFERLAALKAEKIENYFTDLKADLSVAQTFYNIRKNLPVLIRWCGKPHGPEFTAAKKMLDGQLRSMQRTIDVADIMLTDRTGRVLYSANPAHSAGDFLRPLPGPGIAPFIDGNSPPRLTDIFFDSAENNRPAMLAIAPAIDSNRAVIGGIALEIDMAFAYAIIQDTIGLGRTGEILIAKRYGDRVVYLNPLRHDPGAALNRSIMLGSKLARPAQEAALGNTGAGISIDYRGKEVVAAWQHIPSIGWGMVAKIDADEAFAAIYNSRKLVLVVLLLVFGFAGIMAYSIAHSVALPISKLAAGARIIGGGNLDHKVAMASRDEIGLLSREFDAMTGELKRAADSVQRERQRFNSVLEMMPAYVVLLTPDYRVPFANRFFEKRFGKSNGKRCYEYLFNRTEPCDNCETFKVISTKKPHHWEWTGPDGRNYDVHDFPFTDADGSPLIMEMGIDITERVQAEQALKEINATLELRIAERTADLEAANASLRDSRLAAINLMQDAVTARLQSEKATAELQDEIGERRQIQEELQKYQASLEKLVAERTSALRASEEQLRHANEMKMLGTLTSGVAHEVRNPLNGIMALMGALSKELPDDEHFHPYLQHMRNQVSRLTVLMDDLLALGRPIKKDQMAPVSAAALGRRALQSWQQTIGENRAVRFTAPEESDGQLVLLVDADRIEQMIVNLLENAHQHSPADAPIAFSVAAANGSAIFTVSDNGPGIKPEVLPRIFEPFFTTRKGGTGLGLSIVRHIVESHGGVILARNNGENTGATFEVSLPLADQVAGK
jgi:signal transduction histidine kinase/HAMP domain-containing protein